MTPKMLINPYTGSVASSTHGREQDADRRQETTKAEPKMQVRPDTGPISHDQLVLEVKGIYAGLVMVEAKCIDIDEKQTAAAQEKDLSKKIRLKNDQWQSLVALHKQLLHGHHDFFLASQHPAASPALSRLAAKYSMPARMWRHDIHGFLEVLRYRLPDSLEDMLAFIYIAYSMMALLFETVPTFEDTWIECIGDLGRYRMAIEDEEPRDRETWSNVARFWYNKAADKSPTIGRLYHHLAILARPSSLEQLSLYTRALTCVTPFESARGSIMTLFKPILQRTDAVKRRSSSLETCFIRAHGCLFTLTPVCANYLEDLSSGKASNFAGKGSYAAASAIAAIFKHGLFRDKLPCSTIQGVNENTLNRSLDGSEPMIAPGKHDGSATKHQLISTFPHGPGPALDHIPYWKTKDPSYGKTWGSFWRFPVRAACKNRSSPALILTIYTNFIVPITARAIRRDTSNEESGGSFPAAVIPLMHWRKLAFVIITLLMTQYLAYIKDPILVWGCMMAVWAFGWLTIRVDPGTTLSISVVVLLLWAISAYQYGHAAFSKHRISTRVGLITIILSTVNLMRPSGASTAQPELLLSFSLPLVSLILAAMVNAVAFMQSAEQNHALEARPQVHVPYIQEQGLPGRQQRRLRIAIEAHYRPVELPTTPGEGG